LGIDLGMTERGTADAKRGDARPRITAADIRRAIGLGELFVVYQPQVEVHSGGIRGVEALVRWNHALLGALSPGDFLPIAELSGVIVALDDFVLQRACADLARWRDEGHAHLRIAVNLSPRSLEDPGLLGRIAASCDASGGCRSLPMHACLSRSEPIQPGWNAWCGHS